MKEWLPIPTVSGQTVRHNSVKTGLPCDVSKGPQHPGGGGGGYSLIWAIRGRAA